MARDFDYTYALDQALSPIHLLTKLNLDERSRRLALQDEARRRSLHLEDRQAERRFQEGQSDKAFQRQKEVIEDERDERAVEKVRERNAQIDLARKQLYDATGFGGDSRSGTLAEDRKAIELGSKKLRKLLQLQAQANEEVEAALKVDDKDTGKKLLARMVNDPELIGVLSDAQLKGLQGGTISLMDVMRALRGKDRSAVAARYNHHLERLAEESQNEATRKAAIRMREQQSRYNELSGAINIFQRALPPGAIADAYEDPTPPAAPAAAQVDPLDAFLGTAVPAATAPAPVARGSGPTQMQGPAAAWRGMGGLMPVLEGRRAQVAQAPTGPTPMGRFAPFAAAGMMPPPGPGGQGGMDGRVQMNMATQASEKMFGTADRQYLGRVREWYKRKTGASDADIDGLIKAAYQGDPAAQSQIRQVMAAARNEVPATNMAGPYPAFNPSPTPAYPVGPVYEPAR